MQLSIFPVVLGTSCARTRGTVAQLYTSVMIISQEISYELAPNRRCVCARIDFYLRKAILKQDVSLYDCCIYYNA